MPTTSQDRWQPWTVEPASGFFVDNHAGEVAAVQVSHAHFRVDTSFRFENEAIRADILRVLERSMSEPAARAAYDAAVTYRAGPQTTDLASVPQFLRWFENSYGSHTLAAILHDQLIVAEVNAGALRSDTLADHLFRRMLDAGGTPPLKSWIVWTAVAMRSRWAAGGVRRIFLILWTVSSLVGIAAFVTGVITATTSWTAPLPAPFLLLFPIVLPAIVSPLWGRQWGASFVAAIAGLFVVPAAIPVLIGTGVYRALEKMARRWLTGHSRS